MTGAQTPALNLLDTVVLDLLADGWTLLGRSYNGVAISRGNLTVELLPERDTLSVSTLTDGFLFLGHAHSTQGVADLVTLRSELRRDLADRQANIDRAVER